MLLYCIGTLYTCCPDNFFIYIFQGILKAATPNMFEMAKNRLDMFQQKYPMKGLPSWWTWWEKRKSHIFRAFKPSLNAPRANLAESGHSSWKNSGLIHLDLLDAARQDVAENLQLRANLRGYEQGTYSGGKGPSQRVISKRNYAEQEKRAQAFSNELHEYMMSGEEKPQPKSCETFVDEKASHRHDPPRRSSAMNEQTDKSNKSTAKQAKRPCPLRKTRSKSFIRVLDIAKKMKSLSIKSEIIVNEHERHFILAAASGVTYDIEINNSPNCTCKYCNDRDVCSHITWLLLNHFKVPEDDSLLHQRGYTSHEVEGILGKSKKKQSSPCQEKSPRSNSKGHATAVCKWVITKHLLNTKPKCPTCYAEITKDDLKITCDARWTPPHKNKEGQSFTVPRTFHYCLKWECVSGNPPRDSSITEPPSVFHVDSTANFSPDEWRVVTFLDFPLSYE